VIEDPEAGGARDPEVQKVRLYPVTRIEGRGDIEILFTPDQKVIEARFRGLDNRGLEKLVQGLPALRAPTVLARACGTCGTFHQLAACRALEAACGVEVPEAAGTFRELVCWLLLTASHLQTIAYLALPDFALPTSDAAVKNITGIYMVDQETIARLFAAMNAVNESVQCLAGNHFRPAVIVPGGVSAFPGRSERDLALELLEGCSSDLRETMRLAEMLTRRESRIMETGAPLTGHYMASTVEGIPELIGDEISISPFGGGETETVDPVAFIDSVEEHPVPWSGVVPLKVAGVDSTMVGPLARLNHGFGDDTPAAQLESMRCFEQWERPLDRESFFLVALACEAIRGLEKARGLTGELREVSASEKPCAEIEPAAGAGSAVVESPRGLIAHVLEVDDAGRIGSCRIMSPLQFNYTLMNRHLTNVARKNVRGIEVVDADAARLQFAVRSFNPCVPCGTH